MRSDPAGTRTAPAFISGLLPFFCLSSFLFFLFFSEVDTGDDDDDDDGDGDDYDLNEEVGFKRLEVDKGI